MPGLGIVVYSPDTSRIAEANGALVAVGVMTLQIIE
jgi:hypothetical protein